jgi:hypothetical protein
MAPKGPRKPPATSGVKTPTGPLEDALVAAAGAADWLEVSDAAALELARTLAVQIDRDGDPHACRTFLAVLEQLGLTVKGRRDRRPVEEESPLARLQAAARRTADPEARDVSLVALGPGPAARRPG